MAHLFRVVQTVIKGEMARIANVVKLPILAIRAGTAEKSRMAKVAGMTEVARMGDIARTARLF